MPPLKGHEVWLSSVRNVAFSPDGTYIASSVSLPKKVHCRMLL